MGRRAERNRARCNPASCYLSGSGDSVMVDDEGAKLATLG
jgi:hypothetical protein